MAREAIVSAPAVGDLDGDGKVEIVFATWTGTIYAIDAKGQDLPGWPKRLPLVPSCSLDPSKPSPKGCMDAQHDFARGTFGAPVIIDMNKDGRPEIVIGAFDGNIYVFKLDGTVLDGFPVALVARSTTTPGPSRIMSTPTVADLNGDGIPEIMSRLEPAGRRRRVRRAGLRGRRPRQRRAGRAVPPELAVHHHELEALPGRGRGHRVLARGGRLRRRRQTDVLAQGNGSRPLVVRSDPGVQVKLDDPPNRLPLRVDQNGVVDNGFEATSIFGEKTKALEDVMFPLFSQPSIGDMDQDGVPDVVTSGGSLTLAGTLAGGGRRDTPGQQLLAMWSGKTGKMLPGSPVLLEDYTFLVNQTIADVSGDDYPEAITGTGGYFLHAADGCGREAPGFPKFTNGWIAASAAVGDVDGDSQKGLEVVTGTRDGWLFAWHTQGKSTGAIEWESFHHDNANTGNYATKLDQGRAQRASTPLVCEDPVAATEDKFDAGGCGCKTTPSSAGGAGLAAALGALAMAVIRRRRRAT